MADEEDPRRLTSKLWHLFPVFFQDHILILSRAMLVNWTLLRYVVIPSGVYLI